MAWYPSQLFTARLRPDHCVAVPSRFWEQFVWIVSGELFSAW